MPRRSRKPRSRRAPRSRRGRSRLRRLRAAVWPDRAARKRIWRGFLLMPGALQFVVTIMVLSSLWLVSNWLYQVIRKPSELFFPVSGTLYKSPSETWDQYATLFRRHSTATISAEFLAALAQVEGSGNPIVRTYWRWRWSAKPYEIYRPASSAVGMYQITDGTFAEARQLCIHDHKVVADGPWNDWQSCWFNSLYTRTIPGHAVELTSAYLDDRVATALRRAGLRNVSVSQKQDLAAVIHLCGAGAGNRHAARGLRLTANQRCGDHDVRAYIARVNAMKRVFAGFD